MSKHVPIEQLKAYIRAVDDDQLTLVLTEVVRLCVQRKVIGERSVGEFCANVEQQVKGL